MNSFPVKIVNILNNLPENVVNSPNVNTIKNRLDKHWENQEILFNYGAELKINVWQVKYNKEKRARKIKK